MQHAKIVAAAAILIACSACERDVAGGQGSSTTGPAPGTPSTGETLPANGAFVGRAWIGTSGGPERGSVLIFLRDRTLVRDRCPGTLQITEWGVVDGRVRWTEGQASIPIEAEVTLPGPNELRLGIVGRDQETYVAVSAPFACPELPGA